MKLERRMALIDTATTALALQPCRLEQAASSYAKRRQGHHDVMLIDPPRFVSSLLSLA